jgi:hypothetical protein
MFIATMFSYGKDAECVGVDGIVGCMGVFLVYNKMLYAIHVPDNPNKLDMGRDAFVKYVRQEEAKFSGSDATLYGVLNGDNRPDAAKELQAYCRDLFVGRVSIVRVRKNLKVGLTEQAASVLCEFVSASAACNLKYQRNADVKWIKDVGTLRAGFYHNASMSDRLSASAALANGWSLVDGGNSTIEVKDFF